MTDKATASDIWLPPLAAVEAYLYINGKRRGVSLDYRFDADLPEGTRRIPLITAEQADDYARAAVLADRERRSVPDYASMVVMEFSGNEVPEFSQGYRSHELLEVVTAERCAAMVEIIRKQLNAHPAITHCDNCGCDWLDNGLNPVGCPYCKNSDTTQQPVVGECDALAAENASLRETKA